MASHIRSRRKTPITEEEVDRVFSAQERWYGVLDIRPVCRYFDSLVEAGVRVCFKVQVARRRRS